MSSDEIITPNQGIGAEAMSEIAEGQRAYAEAGPWDKLGNFMRISVAVTFLVITVVFFATAHDGGLISASDLNAESTPAAPSVPVLSQN